AAWAVSPALAGGPRRGPGAASAAGQPGGSPAAPWPPTPRARALRVPPAIGPRPPAVPAARSSGDSGSPITPGLLLQESYRPNLIISAQYQAIPISTPRTGPRAAASPPRPRRPGRPRRSAAGPPAPGRRPGRPAPRQ